jgi:hypothetical protein
MQRVMTAAIALLALLSGVAEAQQPPGYGPPYFSPYPPPPPYGSYRPQDPSNARGVPPAQLPPAQPATPPPASASPARRPAPQSPYFLRHRRQYAQAPVKAPGSGTAQAQAPAAAPPGPP